MEIIRTKKECRCGAEWLLEDFVKLDSNVKVETVNKDLLKASEELLFLINQDKDGSYFICEEAKNEVENVYKVIQEIKKEGLI